MNILPLDKQITAVAALCEGLSIRSINTPAMALGVTGKIWSIQDLIEGALQGNVGRKGSGGWGSGRLMGEPLDSGHGHVWVNVISS